MPSLPSPIRTLAASGIKDFRKCWRTAKRSPRSVAPSPLKMWVNSAAFLCSNLSAGISGEVVHVDGGFNIAAMNELELK
ncbi:SDR family oxidoreductase [Klebsiella pneumoniae subsp. pneumoniae]|nr:SDR family oxidoreductase [Klebsiella pneumoniae subsp. pneumoniae]